MKINEFISWCVKRSISFSLEGSDQLKVNAAPGSLTDEVKTELRARKEDIIAWLKKRQREQITALSKGLSKVPLSFTQQRIWFVDRLQKSSAEYNNPMPVRVSGQFRVDAAQQALTDLIQRHDILRSVYQEEGDVLQVILDDFDFTLTQHDLTHLPENEREAAMTVLVDADISKSFDLAQDLMLRAAFIKLADTDGVLLLNIHHIAVDGWSMDVLMQEFVTLYQQIVETGQGSLPAQPLRYADYALWQREWLDEETLDQQVSYWREQIEDAPLIHEIQLDFPRPKTKQHSAGVVRGSLPAKWSQKLQDVANEQQVTVFMLCHAVLSLVLTRHSNSEDIIIGTPIANRQNSALENLVGFFSNTLALRSKTDQQTFPELLEHIKQVNLGAHEHQDVPFDYLIEKLNVPRSPAHTPLFQISFSLNTENNFGAKDQGEFTLPGVSLSLVKSEARLAKFDLDIYTNVNEEGIQFYWIYNDSLFTESRIEQINGHLENLLMAALEAPTAKLTELDMLSQAERTHLITELNPVEHPTCDAIAHTVIHRQFEHAAARFPEAIALAYQGEYVTYQTLNQRANQVAHFLVEQGVTSESFVGVCLDKSIEIIVCVLGILKAGGAYVPMDPTHPEDRLKHILNDSKMPIILANETVTPTLAALMEPSDASTEDPFTPQFVTVSQGVSQSTSQNASQNTYQSAPQNDSGSSQTKKQGTFCQEFAHYSQDNLDHVQVNPQDLAYVIYTSGSTGKPKGVLQTHNNVVRLFTSTDHLYGFNENDHWLLFFSISFDFSVWELWGALFYGGRLVIPESTLTRDAKRMLQLCADEKVTVLNHTPSAFKATTEAYVTSDIAVPDLRYVIFGGEALEPSSIQPWLDKTPNGGTDFINMYGITETMVHASYWKVNDTQTSVSIIGHKLADQTLYVLDQRQQLAPKHAVGELYVGGEGVARGYLNRSELTAERFIQSPFSDDPKDILYRSGDMVSYYRDNELAYHGREDDQVKVRGFRIELGEIINQINQCDFVAANMVVTRKAADDTLQILAYVVFDSAEADRDELVTQLRVHLANILPEYMMPAAFVAMESLPVTGNGKINKAKLPEPEFAASRHYDAPQSVTEIKLVSVWAKLLKLDEDKLSTTANFFDLGGHSLLSVRLLSEIREQLACELDIATVFSHATVREQAAVIDAKLQASEASNFNESDIPVLQREPTASSTMPLQGFALSSQQEQLWFINKMQGGSAEYNINVALDIRGHFDATVAESVISDIIERHEILRTVYVEDEKGPVQIIKPTPNFALNTLDVASSANTDAQIQTLLSEEAAKVFDLENDLVLRATLVRVNEAKSEGSENDSADEPNTDNENSSSTNLSNKNTSNENSRDKNTPQSVFMFTVHHIACDGWSISLLIKEFVTLYRAKLNASELGTFDLSDKTSHSTTLEQGAAISVNTHANITEALAPLSIQYADYAAWSLDLMQGGELQTQRDYWLETLKDLPQVHSLPLDKPRPQQQSFQGGKVAFNVEKPLLKGLKALAKQQHTTLFMMVHSAFSLLLSRYSNEPDIAIGVPVANRRNTALQPLVGFFMNTVVVRTRCDSTLRFTDYLAQVKQTSLEALKHQDVPFQRVLKDVDPVRTQSHSPLFQIMLSMDNNERVDVDLGDLHIKPYSAENLTSKFDMILHVDEIGDDVHFAWEYSADIFHEETAQKMAGHFVELLRSIVATPEANIFALSMVSEEEKQHFIYDLNLKKPVKASEKPVKVGHADDIMMHELFIQQVQKTPNNVAVIDSEGELTYAEVFAAAHALTQVLASTLSSTLSSPESASQPSGLAIDELVPVRMPKGRYQVISTLAIMMAGAAYLPMEAHWPAARCEKICRKAQCRVMLVSRDSEALAMTSNAQADNAAMQQAQNEGALNVINVAEQLSLNTLSQAEIDEVVAIASAFASIQSPTDLAYVIFTSGSTGEPKGVEIEHHAAVNTLIEMNRYYAVTQTDKVLGVSALSFDLSVYDIFGLLAVGGAIVFPDDEYATDPAHWLALIEQHHVTLWDTVPASASLLVDQIEATRTQETATSTAPIRHVLMSGDWIAPSLPARLWKAFPGCKAHSLGGATEGSIWSIHYPIESDTTGWKSVPYGKPMYGQTFYILNEAGEFVPQGAIGELHIGGRGVARGYYGDKAQTDARFIWHEGLNERLYKTGDMGRYFDDGNIEFIGRIDHQVKLRGFRIELGEIESRLNKLYWIDEAIVLIRGEHEHKQLVAYVVVAKDCQMRDASDLELATALKAHLNESLPDYMVPAAFIPLASLPLTANGKVDKKSLPEPDFAAMFGEYVAPSTPTQTTLVDNVAQLLSLDASQISIKANFFELGGHSLLMVKLISKLQQQGFTPKSRALYQQATLLDMANYLDSLENTDEPRFHVPENRIPADCEQITPDLLPLIDLSQDEINHIADQVKGGMHNIQDIYPLGALQQGMLYHHQLSPQNDPYVLEIDLSVNDENALEGLVCAINRVISRHDILRTAFVWEHLNDPVQVVLKAQPLAVFRLDHGTQDGEVNQRPAMQLAQGPLIQLCVSAQDDANPPMPATLFIHHLIIDHEGVELLQGELMQVLQGEEDTLPEPVPYRNAIAYLAQQPLDESLAYFESRLGEITEPTYPYDVPPQAQTRAELNETKLVVSQAQSEHIRAWCKQQGMTPAAFFHGLWALVVGKCSHQTQVAFGTVMSGRQQDGYDFGHAMGLLINTLPVTANIGDTSVKALLRRFSRELLALTSHEQVPLVEAMNCSGVERRVPLFSAVLNYRHTVMPVAMEASLDSSDSSLDSAPGLDIGSGIDSKMPSVAGVRFIEANDYTNYPFLASVDDWGERFSIELVVHQSMDIHAVASYMETGLENLLDALVNEPTLPCARLSILPDSERQKLVSGLKVEKAISENSVNNKTENAAAETGSSNMLIHGLFEKQAQRHPDSISLICGEERLTYEQLNARANRIAHYLKEVEKITPNSLVGLCVTRTVEMVVGTLAILKAGAAYVPIDPAYPDDRKAFMIKDANIALTLTEQTINDTLKETLKVGVDGRTLNLSDTALFADFSKENVTHDGLSNDTTAYVIYTSGSTGEPKGVLTPHRAVSRLVVDQDFLDLGPDTVFMQAANIAFDATTLELWGPLLNGGKVVLYRPENGQDALTPAELNAEIARHQVNSVWLTAGFFKEWALDLSFKADNAKAELASLRQLLTGGDVVSLDAVKQVQQQLPNVQLINGYGPTENTTFSTTYNIGSVEGLDSLPIGQPICGDQVFILDAAQQLAPMGVVGELYVGGEGLAAGYLNLPELTAERFIDNPFIPASMASHQSHESALNPELSTSLPAQPQRLYRTGDRVRYLPDGNIAFVGRVDEQVKLRGFRIELGEIERQLTALEAVESALVMIREYAGNKQLVAYLKPQSLPEAALQADFIKWIRTDLKAQLPDYMVPSFFLLVPQWPLTPNGKIDKRALPEPDISLLQQAYTAPESETESQLVTLWSELLGLPAEQISTSVHFFEIGGNSLLITRMMVRINALFEQEISIEQLFEDLTIAGIANTLDCAAIVDAAHADEDDEIFSEGVL